MSENTPITVAHGDGIGPEIMDATLHIIQEAGARITIEESRSARRSTCVALARVSSRAHGSLCAAQKYFSRHLSPPHRAVATKVSMSQPVQPLDSTPMYGPAWPIIPLSIPSIPIWMW